jgi:hypothetical protein
MNEVSYDMPLLYTAVVNAYQKKSARTPMAVSRAAWSQKARFPF